MRILVTGGAGYIGSHNCVALIEHGHEVIVVDNLVNSCREALEAVETLTNTRVPFYEADCRDRAALDRIFATESIDAVFHFAALKAVGESVHQPLRYFDNNIGATITLCQAMRAAGLDTLVFSSSATVYGVPDSVPITEDAPTAAVNPYGRSKLVSEQLLTDLQAAEPHLRIALLRYFNPGGAHPSGQMGESPQAVPNNLLPYVSQVAWGRLAELRVFGGDYPTRDGTGVRDYIHVQDLASGHVAALDALTDPGGDWADGGVLTVNLGTGTGYSVLEIVAAFERASGRSVPYRIVDRREGDVAACFADPSRAEQLLGWRAEHGIDTICADAWRWQMRYPTGFNR